MPKLRMIPPTKEAPSKLCPELPPFPGVVPGVVLVVFGVVPGVVGVVVGCGTTQVSLSPASHLTLHAASAPPASSRHSEQLCVAVKLQHSDVLRMSHVIGATVIGAAGHVFVSPFSHVILQVLLLFESSHKAQGDPTLVLQQTSDDTFKHEVVLSSSKRRLPLCPLAAGNVNSPKRRRSAAHSNG